MSTRIHVIGSTDSNPPGTEDYDLNKLQTELLTEGVLSGLTVTNTGLTMNMTPGVAVAEVTNTNLAHGKTLKYLISSDADSFVADSEAATRTDIIVCTITPDDPNSTFSNLATFALLKGTTVVPTNSVLIATVTINNTGITAITKNKATLQDSLMAFIEDGKLKNDYMPEISVESLGGDGVTTGTFLQEDGNFVAPTINVETRILNPQRHSQDASGTQSVAHGLSGTPSLVLATMRAKNGSGADAPTGSWGSSNGTVNSCTFDYKDNSFNYISGNAGAAIRFQTMLAIQQATITFNETNVNLIWTKTGNPDSATMHITLTVIKF